MAGFDGFFGHKPISLDEKFRLRIPAEYRSQFGEEGFALCKGPEGEIMVLSQAQFKKFCDAFRNLPTSQSYKKRLFFSGVEIPEEDKQGRFVLSKQFREYAMVDKKVVFVGNGDILEIWGERYQGSTGDEVEPNMTPDEEMGKVKALFEEMAQHGI